MIINNPKKNHDNVKKILEKSQIKLDFIKKKQDFRQYIVNNISQNEKVLDVGQSMREFSRKLNVENDTLDINKFEGYPSIQADLCEKNLSQLVKNKYDSIICLAVLEHCYDPFEAVKNIKDMLKINGKFFGYVPFLYNYHAPENLKFYDFFRFSKDGVSYLLKDFKEIEIFPVRGKFSALGNMLLGGYWKNFLEKFSIHILIDKFMKDKININQTSGFYFIAKK
jgi:SAM-dependent methyltransferase